MNAKDYFASKGIEPSTTFICEYCGLEKPNSDASLITVAVCKDCYELDPASLRAKVTRLKAENERMKEVAEKILGKAYYISCLGTETATRISVAGEIINLCVQLNCDLIDIEESALSPSTDESEE